MSTWANCYKLVQGFRVTCYSLVSTILKVMTWLQMLYSCWSDQPLVGWIKVLLQPSYWDQTNTIKCINVFLGSNHVKINVIINLLIKSSFKSSFTLFTIFCIFIQFQFTYLEKIWQTKPQSFYCSTKSTLYKV